MVFKKKYNFPRFQRGPTFSRGGRVQRFSGGGGGQMLISLETHITCDFPWGPYPYSPPDPRMMLNTHLFNIVQPSWF